jgi:hypothetical protein
MADVSPSSPAEAAANSAKPKDFERGFRFWVIVIGLAVTSVLSALEHTVVTTSAPAILSDLDLRQDYVWITNSFFICRYGVSHCAFLPSLSAR